MVTSGGRARPRHPVERNGGDGGADRLLKAFTHPLRVAILARLDEEVLSPKELARELQMSLPVVSYHVRELERLKLIELVRTAQRRGAVQHWYRAKAGESFEGADWSRIPSAVRREIVGVALARLEAAVASASEEGGFDRSEVQISRETLELDERGFGELANLLGGLHGSLEKIGKAARRRLSSAGEQPLNATLSVMLFEGPYSSASRPGE